jgi:lysozyme family protein
MNQTLKKILFVAGPVVGLSAIFYLWYRSQKPKKTFISNNKPSSAPPKKGSSSLSNPNFPLQLGSRNDLVKKLQAALGVTSDGIFGQQTLSALQSQIGVSTVPDQNTLNAIIQGAGTKGEALRTAAEALYNQFQQGGQDISVKSYYFADEVTEDAYGHLIPTGMGFDMNPGATFDNTTYKIDGDTLLGLTILKASDGPLQGEYTVDPAALTLVPHLAATYGGLFPVTDPTTGLTTF